MRSVLYPVLAALALGTAAIPAQAAAEEFKYYVWVDEEGIVHASEEAPKGRDYKVRIIEDINANVVPAEDFRLDNPFPGTGAGTEAGQSAPRGSGTAGQSGQAAEQETPAGQ